MTVGCWRWVKGERDLATFRTAKIVAPSASVAELEARALLALGEHMDVWTVLEAVELPPAECRLWARWHDSEPSAVELLSAELVDAAAAVEER